ncbi:MAG TPA: trypsin-like serine protease [Polyangiaceae bacterium]|nr:trypsin-like serine protease [Polyangiaceae bacterium]
MRLMPVLLSVLFCSACADAPAEFDEEIGATRGAIEDGELANQFARNRAGVLARITSGGSDFKCTVTKIAPRYVITALHCNPRVGDTVVFYGTGSSANFNITREVVSVGKPPGTSVSADAVDWTDVNDKFADIAILRLDSAVTDTPFATLAWYYPGDDHDGVKIGAGKHEGQSSLLGQLRRKSDTTYSGDDDGGGFRTGECALNDGDEGGAFYDPSKLLGVANGCTVLGGFVNRGRYTSIPEHLDWIVDVIDYVWSGGPTQTFYRSGTEVGVAFAGSRVRCKYACDHSADCDAFNWQSQAHICQMVKNVTGATSSSIWQSALK